MKNNHAELTRFISISEALQKLGGVSRATFFRLRQQPDFPRGYQITPGRIVFSEAELESFVIGQREEPNSND